MVEQALAQPGAHAAAARALFVSADAACVDDLIGRLRESGIRVSAEIAATRQAFEQALARNAYAVIAIDYALPGWSGAEALSELHRREIDTPVILVSPGLDEESAAEWMRNGASGYVRRDRPERFAAAVMNMLEQRRHRPPLPRASEEASHGGAALFQVLDTAPDAIFATRPDGSVLFANRAAEALFGRGRGELAGVNVDALLSDRGHGRPAAAGCVAKRGDGSEVPVEVRCGHTPGAAGGELVTWTVRESPVHSGTGGESRIHGRHFAEMLESATDAYFTLDLDGRYRYVNHKASQILGRPGNELQGRSIWDENPEAIASPFAEQCRLAAEEQRPARFTAYCRHRALWADIHVFPFEEGIAVCLIDRTARKLLDEQAGDAQRMEALGRLAGGVAHDFNNLLTIIGGYSQLVLDHVDFRSPLRKDLEPIAEAAGRASALTHQLLAFSRRQIVQPKVVDLNRLIAKMNKMLRRVIGEDVDLRVSLRGDLGRIKADPTQLEQVVMNLAVNARDAMPTGGCLRIATDNVEVPETSAELPFAPGSYILLAVSDTGTGMDEYARAHLFEPFFTTKERGRGTGLGLATVYGIVKQAGGEIAVTSAPGEGTTFQIFLPRARRTPKTRQDAAGARRPRRGNETILLVEDDQEVRAIAREMLVRLGYRVIEAGDSSAALALWSQHRESIELLVTDVIMPGMSGRELTDRITAEHPDLKVLFISGYTDEVLARYGVLEAHAALLQKPFTRETLGLRVRNILDTGRAAAQS